MSSPFVSARLHYLSASARLLSRAAPTTSAVLEAEYDGLVRAQGLKPSAARDREVCNACGNILVPGRSCQVRLRPKQQSANEKSAREEIRKNARKVKQSTAKTAAVRKMLVYSCKRCQHETRFNLQTPPKTKATITKSGARAHETLPTTPAENSRLNAMTSRAVQPQPAEVKASANAASKQRAKARKQGSLQAMLAKSKAETTAAPSGSNFELMDFMKHS